jgi:phage tail-like protein
MARSANNDPLEKFRFQVDFSIPNDTLTGLPPTRVGFHDVQMPKRSTSKIMYREGDHADINMISAGLSSMEDISMSRGLLPADAGGDLYKWMKQVHTPSPGTGALAGTAPLVTGESATRSSYRAEVTVKMLGRDGKVVRAWKLYNCFPVNFVSGSDLNAQEDGDKSIESLTLTFEDFQEMLVTGGVVETTSSL